MSCQHQNACARCLSSFLATSPVRVREHCQFFSHLSIFKHLSPVSLTFQIPGKPFHFGKTRHLLAQFVHDECYVCSLMLNLTQWFSLFLFHHIKCRRCLHRIAVLKSKVLYEHVDVSGIVLIHDSSLLPVQPPVQRLDALRRSITDDLRFDGIDTCHFPLELHQFLCRPCEDEIVTVSQTRYLIFFVMKQILRAESKLKSPVPDVLLPITFPIAGRTFPASVPILSSTGSRISTGFRAFAWKYARDTLMCMIETVSLWLNANIRDLIGTPSNALSVSTHFVSSGVIPYFSTASFSSTFSYTPRSRKYFSSSSRASRTACHGNSLPVMSSKHMTSCSFTSSEHTVCIPVETLGTVVSHSEPNSVLISGVHPVHRICGNFSCQHLLSERDEFLCQFLAMKSFKWCLPVTTCLAPGQDTSGMLHQPWYDKRVIIEWFLRPALDMALDCSNDST